MTIPVFSPVQATPVHGYECLAVYPHDPAACTQGLIHAGEVFYEGTGLTSASSLRKVAVETGAILLRHDLPVGCFGEGITALRDTLYQLTWQNHIGFAYVERDTFELIETFPYPWEGWGLTHDGLHLIASDGTAVLRRLDPRTREEVGRVDVQDEGQPVTRLNELEYVAGRIYANIWYSDRIAVIHPASGAVEAWIDLGALRDSLAGHPTAGVLNGIAYDPATVRLFVTGKFWPKIFAIDTPTLHSAGADPSSGPGRDRGRLTLGSVSSPCNGFVRIEFELPVPRLESSSQSVVVQILDLQGRLLRAFPIGQRSPGSHTLSLNTGPVPAGTAFLRLAAGNSFVTRKLLMVN